MKINKSTFIVLSLCGLIPACTQSEENILSNNKVAKIVATIGSTVENRVAVDKSSFDTNDQIGFYAQGGLEASNICLTYEDGFHNEALQWTGGNATNIFAYFPYSDTPGNIDIYNNNKFEDILTATKATVSEGAIVSLGFNHRFALLSVVRGEGFKNTNVDQKITVSLNKQVATTADITYDKNNLNGCDLTLKEDQPNGIDKLITETEDIIVPVGTINSTPLNMTSITLTNDAGREVTINYNIAGGFKRGNKYIITAMMRNNQAIVNPCEIIQWNQEDINITKPTGIEGIDNLKDWIAAYNGSTDNRDNILAQFGTKKDNKWTFLLLNDIDINGNTLNPIENFNDIFDGQGHTITGLNITEDNNSASEPLGFVRTLKEGAAIRYLTLHNAILHCKSGQAVGGFAGIAEAGSTIFRCTLAGSSIIYGTGITGAIVGDGTNATLTENEVESEVFVYKSTN